MAQSQVTFVVSCPVEKCCAPPICSEYFVCVVLFHDLSVTQDCVVSSVVNNEWIEIDVGESGCSLV